jgi:hypothetical protein
VDSVFPGLEVFFSVFEVELITLGFQNLAELGRSAEENGHLKKKSFTIN